MALTSAEILLVVPALVGGFVGNLPMQQGPGGGRSLDPIAIANQLVIIRSLPDEAVRIGLRAYVATQIVNATNAATKIQQGIATATAQVAALQAIAITPTPVVAAAPATVSSASGASTAAPVAP